MTPIKVLVIDDSALMRKLLSEMLARDPQIDVVGTATDAFVARDKIKRLNPDVLTLDIEMPKMDGLDFLERLMRLRPMPVVMVSTLTEKGSEVTLKALELGAVDFVSKPKLDIANSMRDYAAEITDKIRAATSATKVGKARITMAHRQAPSPATATPTAPASRGPITPPTGLAEP